MRRLFPLLVTMFVVTAASAADPAQRDESAPFGPGERMEYAVSYGVVPAGSMTLELTGIENVGGRPAYHAVFRARSNRAVSFLYEIASLEESWFDAREIVSLRYKRVSTEKGKTREKDVQFDQARQVQIVNGGEPEPTSPRAVDQLAMMYYMRTLPLAPGKSFVLQNQADPSDNPVRIRVLKQERVKVAGGTFDTYVIDLNVKTDSGIFKKGGTNRIWVTRDERKVPVKISSKIGMGSFQAELVEYSPGR